MSLMTDIISSLFIQNREVYNFFTYFTNRNSNKGIFKYITDSGLRVANISSNYNGGRSGRYGYTDNSHGEIEDTTNAKAINNGRNGTVKANFPSSEGRGDGYYVGNNTDNSSLKFITTKEFYDFEAAIRESNITKDYFRDTTEWKYQNYANAFFSEDYSRGKMIDTKVENSNLGDKYIIEENNPTVLHDELSKLPSFLEDALIFQRIVKDKINRRDSYEKYKKYSNGNVGGIVSIKNIEEEKYKKLKDIYSAANDKRDEISLYRRDTNLIIDAIANTKPITEDGYGSFYIKKDEKDEITYDRETSKFNIIPKGGLLDYYQSYRDKYIPSDNSLISEYSISRESLITRSQLGNLTYSFYQESDGDSVIENFETSNITDNSSITMMDYDPQKGGIVNYVNGLFYSAKTETLINRFHTRLKGLDSDFITAYDSRYGLSRGRALITEGAENNDVENVNGYSMPYCRTWTSHHQYSTLQDRIRGKQNISVIQNNLMGLRPNNGTQRLVDNGVTAPNGFIRFAPTHNNGAKSKNEKNERVKNYMFSIENLAWKDVISTANLSEEQIGPNNGRIMWFPPYNLKFTENVSANWSDNNFIGRGEKIYTYMNTERSGTLSFTLLIDHPSNINKWRGTSQFVDEKEKRERELLRYFAGCQDLEGQISGTGYSESEPNTTEEPSREPKMEAKTKDITYVIFFPHNYSGIDDINNGEISKAISNIEQYSDVTDESAKYRIPPIKTGVSKNINTTTDVDKTKNYLLGGDKNIEVKFISDIKKIEDNFKNGNIFGMPNGSVDIVSIDIKAYSSNYEEYDMRNRRANTMKDILMYYCSEINVGLFNECKNETIINNGSPNANSDEEEYARAAVATFHIKWNEENKPTQIQKETSTNLIAINLEDDLYYGGELNEAVVTASRGNINSVVTVENNEDKYSADNEYLYFSEISETDKLAYKNIIDQVRYFTPAFHSITPEGFNSRLSFLHQCTRQGPTNSLSSGNIKEDNHNYQKYAGNLSFGRAPYCILRIGDFFNTKICITSLSIDYDNSGIQWDLNPEGVGVQPMFANININFNFLGGQDISGPIERLQNAVTSNFYANESVYNKRSDTESTYYNPWDEENTKIKAK